MRLTLLTSLALIALTGCTNPEKLDLDEDGVELLLDCDDHNAAIFPGAVELCNGLDDNCDGVVDGGDATDAPTWYADTDGDGFGALDNTQSACVAPAGYVSTGTDCDDAAVEVHPGAAERCDGVDDDCDGAVDDDAPGDAVLFADADADGFGDPTASRILCGTAAGYVADPTDCDDADAAVHPGADELCNGLDDDCAGGVDVGASDASVWYLDLDGDTYGLDRVQLTACEAPAGYVGVGGDCDDGDYRSHPDAQDRPGNAVDEDCDGTPEPNLIYVAGAAGALTAVDVDRRRISWQEQYSEVFTDVVMGPDGALYLGVEDKGVFRADHDGTGLSAVATGLLGSFGLSYDYGQDVLLIASSAGYVSAVDPATGAVTELFSGLEVEEPAHAVRNAGNDTVLVTTTSGKLFSGEPGVSPLEDIGLSFTAAPRHILRADIGSYRVGLASGQVFRWGSWASEVGEIGAFGRSITGSCHGTTRGGDYASWATTADGALAGEGGSNAATGLESPVGCASNALADDDGDGFVNIVFDGSDCDDADGDVFPDALDIPGDGFDGNCDRVDGIDADGDRQASVATGGGDCDDHDAAVFMGVAACPAESCLAIGELNDWAPSGPYTLTTTSGAHDVYCFLEPVDKGWTLVHNDDFEAGAAGWTPAITGAVGAWTTMLGGVDGFDGSTVATKTYDLLAIPHDEAMVYSDVAIFDTHNSGDVWLDTLGTLQSTAWVGESDISNQGGGVANDTLYFMPQQAAHSANDLPIEFRTVFGLTNFWAVDNVQVWVR